MKFDTKENLENALKYVPNDADLSDWDVSNITDMSYIFAECNFNGNISNWDTSKVTNMRCMFAESQFNRDISSWDISNVTNMNFMFAESKFNQKINPWTINTDNCRIVDMFYNCPILDEYKPVFYNSETIKKVGSKTKPARC